MEQSDIGVYGLGVMGRNLALNLEEKGHTVSIYNRMDSNEEGMVRAFLEQEGKGKRFTGSYSPRYFVQTIKKPRKILLMVKAGAPVDSVIEELKPHLSEGDIIIDGGNSHYSDTTRRFEDLKADNIHFIGMGVSGGEEGARLGPSLMPGGSEAAWKSVRPLLEFIAARTPDDQPCCAWLGKEGAGHFVKMVHNGIEYGLMQLLAETYHFMTRGLAMDADETGDTFDSWNGDLLSSYLMEITTRIFHVKDDNNNLVLDVILDAAGQKGTGRWTAQTALELGIPLPLITEAVFARALSSFKGLREEVSGEMPVGSTKIETDRKQLLESLRQALLASSMVAYAEGFSLLKAANDEWEWSIPPATVARIWQGGCIIRSSLLGPVAEAYDSRPALPHLLLAPFFKQQIGKLQQGWRSAVALASKYGIPMPAMSAALTYFDALRTKRLPANLIQAQRDYFGAHTYERTDRPRGDFFHTDWNVNRSSS